MSHLADVVEQGAALDVVHLVGRHFQLLGQRGGDPRHVFGVFASIVLVQLEHRDQPVDCQLHVGDGSERGTGDQENL